MSAFEMIMQGQNDVLELREPRALYGSSSTTEIPEAPLDRHMRKLRQWLVEGMEDHSLINAFFEKYPYGVGDSVKEKYERPPMTEIEMLAYEFATERLAALVKLMGSEEYLKLNRATLFGLEEMAAINRYTQKIVNTVNKQ